MVFFDLSSIRLSQEKGVMIRIAFYGHSLGSTIQSVITLTNKIGFHPLKPEQVRIRQPVRGEAPKTPQAQRR
jgi:hypothetical protein